MSQYTALDIQYLLCHYITDQVRQWFDEHSITASSRALRRPLKRCTSRAGIWSVWREVNSSTTSRQYVRKHSKHFSTGRRRYVRVTASSRRWRALWNGAFLTTTASQWSLWSNERPTTAPADFWVVRYEHSTTTSPESTSTDWWSLWLDSSAIKSPTHKWRTVWQHGKHANTASTDRRKQPLRVSGTITESAGQTIWRSLQWLWSDSDTKSAASEQWAFRQHQLFEQREQYFVSRPSSFPNISYADLILPSKFSIHATSHTLPFLLDHQQPESSQHPDHPRREDRPLESPAHHPLLRST